MYIWLYYELDIIYIYIYIKLCNNNIHNIAAVFHQLLHQKIPSQLAPAAWLYWGYWEAVTLQQLIFFMELGSDRCMEVALQAGWKCLIYTIYINYIYILYIIYIYIYIYCIYIYVKNYILYFCDYVCTYVWIYFMYNYVIILYIYVYIYDYVCICV